MDTPKTEPVQHERERDKEKKTASTDESKPDAESKKKQPADKKSSVKTKPKRKNNVRKLRMERMMSKAELARRAGLSTLTVDRVEKGMPCRMDTKRKILEALGLTPSDRVTVFGEDD
jgi:DNA-binding XRE family transcriptional regulator